MKKRVVTILWIFFMGTFLSSGQNFIGLHADEVMVIMKRDFRDFNLNTTTVNKYFNYLKYENEEGTQTMLIFLDDRDHCKYVKRICDYVLLPEMTVQLNAHAKRENDTLWVFEYDQQVFSQVLTKEDWYFTITTRPVLKPQ